MREVRRSLLEFAPHGALPSQHIRVVVGVDFERPGFRLALA